MKSRILAEPHAAMRLFFLTAFLTILGMPAQATSMITTDPSSVSSALIDSGYKAKLFVSKSGDPYIDTASGGNKIFIYFFGCRSKNDCDQIEFFILWNCENELKKCNDVQNKWNSKEEFSNAVMLPDGLAIYRYLLIDKVGISSILLIKNIEYMARDAGAIANLF